MTRLSLALIILAHLTGPPMAWCPGEDRYRVEMLEDRVRRTEAIRLWAIRHGVKVTAEMEVWR